MKSNSAVPGGSLKSKPTWWNTCGCSTTSAFVVLGGTAPFTASRRNPTVTVDPSVAVPIAAPAKGRQRIAYLFPAGSRIEGKAATPTLGSNRPLSRAVEETQGFGSKAKHWKSSSPCWSARVSVQRISSLRSSSFRHDTHRLGFVIRSGLISVPSSSKKPDLGCSVITSPFLLCSTRCRSSCHWALTYAAKCLLSASGSTSPWPTQSGRTSTRMFLKHALLI